jgi:enoyl-CoA hydratase/carnithine racemase/carbon monoxide dehydrogenase subunit G
MDMTGQVRLHAARARIWQVLNDPAALALCIDGCEALERTTDNEFAATVIIKAGPVKARFTGKVCLQDIVAPQRYTLVGEATGGAAGFANAQIQVTLEALEPELTLLEYRVAARVGGKLAQLGARLIDTTATHYAERFFAALAQYIAAHAGDSDPTASHASFRVAAQPVQPIQPIGRLPDATYARDLALTDTPARSDNLALTDNPARSDNPAGIDSLVGIQTPPPLPGTATPSSHPAVSSIAPLHWPRSARQAAQALGASPDEVQALLDAQLIKVWIADQVAIVTLNRPSSRNAMTLAMWRSMPTILARLEDDPAVRAVILTGAGEDFCAGADISEFAKVRDNPAQSFAYEVAVDACCDAISQFNKPSIAVLRGYCLGGGAHLAMSCDFRYAAHDAVFGIPAAKLSIIYGVKGTLKLLTLVGLPQAKRILFGAERFSARKALAIGFVDHVAQTALPVTRAWFASWLSRPAPTEPGDPMADARAFAKSLASNAPLTQRGAKALLNGLALSSGALDLDYAEALIAQATGSADYHEGRRAFAERRAPNFQGR